MCINASMVLMLRAVINDLDSESFTDERLEQLLAVSAQFVNREAEGTYVINITSPDITPDPVDVPDDAFVNLTVIKAACMVDQGNMRMKAAIAGLSASAGPASMNVGASHFTAYKDIIELGPCAMYQQMLADYKFGSGAICHGILSPFISNTFDPSNLHYNSTHERF
jgi:hypothetical protein